MLSLGLEYIGDEMPTWVAEGVRVKVTPETRRYGLQSRHDTQDRVQAGEVGVIRKQAGNGWWSWVADFPRGLTHGLRAGILDNLIRVESTDNV